MLLTIIENTEIFIHSGVKQSTRVWHCCQILPRLTLVTCFPTFETVPKLAAFDTGYMFFAAFHTGNMSPAFETVPRSQNALSGFMLYKEIKLRAHIGLL